MNEKQNEDPRTPRRICVLTVGTGTAGKTSQLEAGLAHAIEHYAADLTILVPSSAEESLLMAEEVEERCGDRRVEVSRECFSNPDELLRSRREFRDLLRRLHQRFPEAHIEVNPTSGTKQMTAGAVLATMDQGMASLSFISGPRRDGVVITGQERLTSVDGHAMLAYRAAMDATMLMRAGAFNAAALLLDPYRDLLPLCHATAMCLHDWHRFAYRHALRHAGNHPALAPVRRTLARLAQAGPFSLDRAADMMAFVRRELAYVHPEEALAALYRLVEHLARHVLVNLGLQPDALTLKAIEERISPPKPLADRLRSYAGQNRQETLILGLALTLELIGSTGCPLDAAFRRDSRTWKLLQQRQRTRYGHGFEFVDRAQVEELAERVDAIAQKEFPDFASLTKQSQFPDLEPLLQEEIHHV